MAGAKKESAKAAKEMAKKDSKKVSDEKKKETKQDSDAKKKVGSQALGSEALGSQPSQSTTLPDPADSQTLGSHAPAADDKADSAGIAPAAEGTPPALTMKTELDDHFPPGQVSQETHHGQPQHEVARPFQPVVGSGSGSSGDTKCTELVPYLRVDGELTDLATPEFDEQDGRMKCGTCLSHIDGDDFVVKAKANHTRKRDTYCCGDCNRLASRVQRVLAARPGLRDGWSELGPTDKKLFYKACDPEPSSGIWGVVYEKSLGACLGCSVCKSTLRATSRCSLTCGKI
jgi:hypothetical protein